MCTDDEVEKTERAGEEQPLRKKEEEEPDPERMKNESAGIHDERMTVEN